MQYYRGVFGGSVSYEYMKQYSPLTLIFILINVIIFIVGNLLGMHRSIIFFGGMIPLNIVIETNEYWRLITSMFIHSNFMHIAFNMVILYHAGAYFEQKNGSKNFLKFYLLTGLFVSICTGLLSDGISIGASGAIFALLGYILYYELQARKLGIPTNSMIIPLVVINALFTLVIPKISVVGHFSGLLIGYLIPLFLTQKKTRY